MDIAVRLIICVSLILRLKSKLYFSPNNKIIEWLESWIYVFVFYYFKYMYSRKNNGSRSMDMYKYGNKSNFDFDQGLKVLMKLNESDDFYYNMPLQGAQVHYI